MTKEMTISIVILTNNSLGTVNRLVDRILPELTEARHELLFLDNNSTDGTPDYLLSIPFPNKRVMTVPKGTFSHSGTRMWGAENCSGDVIVFFTDDIIPCSERFLGHLVAPVLEKRAIAAYGVSLINPATGDPLRAHRYNGWFVGFPELVEPISPQEWEKLSPAERRLRCNFDNCAACYDRHVLLDVRFPPLSFGEDLGIARLLLLNGYRLALSKNARFYHWHNVSYNYLIKRSCVDQSVTIDLFGLYYSKTLARTMITICLQTGLYALLALMLRRLGLKARLHWLIYSIKFIIADNAGKYIGGLQKECLGPLNVIGRFLIEKKERYLQEVSQKSIKRDS